MIFSNTTSKDDVSMYPKAIQKALAWAQSTDFDKLEDGRVPIDGDDMFCNLFHLTTKPKEETYPELHRQYVDVQFWLEGEELCGAAPADGIGELVEDHYEENDIAFYNGVKNESFLHAWKGCYAVFFPSDAHRPGVASGGKSITYRKAVVKVNLNLLRMP